jgi:hypothetical protein
MNLFKSELQDFLAEAHMTDIEEILLKPAIKQIIDDCEDYMSMVEKGDTWNKEEIVDTSNALELYKHIQRLIEKGSII